MEILHQNNLCKNGLFSEKNGKRTEIHSSKNIRSFPIFPLPISESYLFEFQQYCIFRHVVVTGS